MAKTIENNKTTAKTDKKSAADKKAPADRKSKTADKPKTDKKPKTDTASDTDNKPHTTEPTAEIIPAANTSVVIATKELIAEHLKSLEAAVKSHEKTFFKIGLELYWFYRTQAFVEIDSVAYDNIADFAKRRYGISKATTYQYIGIYDRFGEFNANGDCIGIRPDYSAYGSTQLLVMSQMTDEMLAKCTPAQKIHELKALLKGIPENDDDTDSESGADGEKQENTRRPFNTIKTANTQELYSFTTVEEIEKKQAEILETIKRTVGQGVNGVNYGVSIVMTW